MPEDYELTHSKVHYLQVQYIHPANVLFYVRDVPTAVKERELHKFRWMPLVQLLKSQYQRQAQLRQRPIDQLQWLDL